MICMVIQEVKGGRRLDVQTLCAVFGGSIPSPYTVCKTQGDALGHNKKQLVCCQLGAGYGIARMQRCLGFEAPSESCYNKRRSYTLFWICSAIELIEKLD